MLYVLNFFNPIYASANNTSPMQDINLFFVELSSQPPLNTVGTQNEHVREIPKFMEYDGNIFMHYQDQLKESSVILCDILKMRGRERLFNINPINPSAFTINNSSIYHHTGLTSREEFRGYYQPPNTICTEMENTKSYSETLQSYSKTPQHQQISCLGEPHNIGVEDRIMSESPRKGFFEPNLTANEILLQLIDLRVNSQYDEVFLLIVIDLINPSGFRSLNHIVQQKKIIAQTDAMKYYYNVKGKGHDFVLLSTVIKNTRGKIGRMRVKLPKMFNDIYQYNKNCVSLPDSIKDYDAENFILSFNLYWNTAGSKSSKVKRCFKIIKFSIPNEYKELNFFRRVFVARNFGQDIVFGNVKRLANFIFYTAFPFHSSEARDLIKWERSKDQTFRPLFPEETETETSQKIEKRLLCSGAHNEIDDRMYGCTSSSITLSRKNCICQMQDVQTKDSYSEEYSKKEKPSCDFKDALSEHSYFKEVEPGVKDAIELSEASRISRSDLCLNSSYALEHEIESETSINHTPISILPSMHVRKKQMANPKKISSSQNFLATNSRYLPLSRCLVDDYRQAINCDIPPSRFPLCYLIDLDYTEMDYVMYMITEKESSTILHSETS